MDEGTSPMRLATIAAMTSAAARDAASARLLGTELEARTYERRSDGDLLDLAESVGVPSERRTELAMLSAERSPEHATKLCPKCADTGQVDLVGDGWFVRCSVCNPQPVVEEL